MLMLKISMVVLILSISMQSSDAEHDYEEINDFEDNDHYDDTTSEEMDNTIPLETIPEKYLTSHEHWASSNANGTLKIYTNIRPNKYLSSHEQYPTLKDKKNEKNMGDNSSKKKNKKLDKDSEITKKVMRKDSYKLSKHFNKLSSHEADATKNGNKPVTSETNELYSENNAKEKVHKRTTDDQINATIEELKDTSADLKSAKEEDDDEYENEEEKTTGRERKETEDIKIEQRTKEREKIDKNERPKKELKYQYTVSVQKRNSHYASGALLSPRWVITSGREFYHVRESIKLFQVRYGTVNCKRGPTVRIMTIVMHPGYNPPNYDLSLLKLASEVTTVRPIPLGLKAKSGEAFVSTYWTRLIINGTVLPNDAEERFKSHSLRVSKQNLIPYNWCKKELKYYGVNLTYASFCLKPIVEHHSECLQDPGAPVVFNNALHGVSSGWSGSCYDGLRVTVVAAVTEDLMKEWIIGTISG